MTSGSIVTANPHIFRKLPYNPDKDLVAITNVASGPQIDRGAPELGGEDAEGIHRAGESEAADD